MTASSADRPSALAMLNEAHRFPCTFAFKAIGTNEPTFVAQLAQAAVVVLGPNTQPEVRTRESAHGRHVAVTLSVPVATAEQVLDVYQALKSVAGLHMLL